LDSRIGALDRSLGFVFGAVRGLLLCVVAFYFYSWLVPPKNHPEWIKTSRTAPILTVTGEGLLAMLPDDPEGMMKSLRRLKGDEPTPEENVPPATSQSGPRT
jgi:membrane protein required for colicin V production